MTFLYLTDHIPYSVAYAFNDVGYC